MNCPIITMDSYVDCSILKLFPGYSLWGSPNFGGRILMLQNSTKVLTLIYIYIYMHGYIKGLDVINR